MTALTILVRPGSARTAVEWDPWRRLWVVACHAPPSEGRANEEVLELLSEALTIPRARLRWVRGARVRRKTIEVDGLSGEEIARRLAAQRRAGSSEGPAGFRPPVGPKT